MTAQTCPRRMGEPGPWEREAGLDSWLEVGGQASPVCSFCGSLNPGVFLELVSEGWPVGPTDKNYKAYLYGTDDSEVKAKFYYQHLSIQQQEKFIEFHNTGLMRLGEPGWFYVLPFFIELDTHPES